MRMNFCFLDGINICPSGSLSSLSKPCDPWDIFSYPPLTQMLDLYIIRCAGPFVVMQFTVNSVLNAHSKIDKTKILMTNGSLMKVKSIAECSPWSILQYF